MSGRIGIRVLSGIGAVGCVLRDGGDRGVDGSSGVNGDGEGMLSARATTAGNTALRPDCQRGTEPVGDSVSCSCARKDSDDVVRGGILVDCAYDGRAPCVLGVRMATSTRPPTHRGLEPVIAMNPGYEDCHAGCKMLNSTINSNMIAYGGTSKDASGREAVEAAL